MKWIIPVVAIFQVIVASDGTWLAFHGTHYDRLDVALIFCASVIWAIASVLLDRACRKYAAAADTWQTIAERYMLLYATVTDNDED